MSDYHIRLATVDDFDGVMDIGDVYMGADYLRNCYHTFMADRNVRSYVYIIGKQIFAVKELVQEVFVILILQFGSGDDDTYELVASLSILIGFCSVHLIDDGLTFLVRAGRVKKGLQGKGVYSCLLKHVYAEYKDVDSIKYDVMTASNYNFEANKESLENTYMYTVSSRKTILSYQFETEEIDPPALTHTSSFEEVNSSTMTSLLEDEKTRDTLFPEGKMIINWVPLRLFTSNMKYIMTPDTFALWSISEVSLLTVGTPIECQLGLRYVIDVFGSDVRVLRHHIIRHLEHLKSLTQKQVVLEIVTSSDFGKTVDDIMKHLRISSFHNDLWTEIISLEKGFK